jgi:rod shape-determining protein MreB
MLRRNRYSPPAEAVRPPSALPFEINEMSTIDAASPGGIDIVLRPGGMGMFSTASDMAIDLGTVNTCIYTRGAVALSEPSVVAFNTVNGGIEAVGTEARDMLGRTPANITPVWPVRNGVIADFAAVEKMLAHFVRKARGRSYTRARLVIGVPAASTQVERRAVKDSVNRIRVRDVSLVDEPMAAAIGAGLPVTEPTGNMIIDIGGGTTDIAVVSLAGVVYASSLRIAGGDMDEAIIQYLKRRHNLLIGHATAERIKCELGSAAPLEKSSRMEVKGRHLSEGVPRTVTICDAEVRDALSEPVKAIVKAVREALECVPPELCGDIYERGVVLTGGVAFLRKLDEHLRKETGLPVVKAKEPLATVIIGAGRLLSDRALLSKVTVN